MLSILSIGKELRIVICKHFQAALTHYQPNKTLETSISPFPTVSLNLSEKNCTIWATLKFSPAYAFNFDKAKICRLVKG